MATDYLILIQSPNAQTVLVDPLGPAAYNLTQTADGEAPQFVRGALGWRSIELGPRGNEPGVGSFVSIAAPELLTAVLTPEARIVVIREPDGEAAYIEMAGPIENVKLGYEAGRDGTDGYGLVTVQFADDPANLAYRLVYPNPAQASTAQSVTKYTITATNAEDAARALVNLNAGPGALTARKYPELALGVDSGVGTSVSTSFIRAVTLTDALREVLRLGGNLGMRTYQGDDNVVRFEVYAPRDLTATVWYSRDLGNVRSLEFEHAAPSATVAIVGDDQAGVARVVKERSNTAALAAGWRRKEVWVDGRSAANATELEQAGDEALADTGPTARVNVVAIETPMQRYRTHVRIFDRVSVEVFDGYVVEDVIRGFDIKVTPEREEISPLIGAEGDGEIDLKAAALAKLRKRIAQLEGSL